MANSWIAWDPVDAAQELPRHIKENAKNFRVIIRISFQLLSSVPHLISPKFTMAAPQTVIVTGITAMDLNADRDNTADGVGVASSQPDIDGTCLDEEMIDLVKSQVAQQDVWLKKLAALEKRVEQLQKAIKTGKSEDVPNDCKVRRVELPNLPAGLMYSLEIRMNHQRAQKSHQMALLSMYVTEIKGIQIAAVESSLHKLISNSKAEFTQANLPIEAIKMYTILTAERRNNRQNLLIPQAPEPALSAPSTSHVEAPERSNSQHKMKSYQQKKGKHPYKKRQQRPNRPDREDRNDRSKKVDNHKPRFDNRDRR